MSASDSPVDVLRRHQVTVSGGRGGRPIVFGTGFGADQAVCRSVAPALTVDYQVVQFDHVGMGGSDLSAFSPDRYDSLWNYTPDVLEIYDALSLRDSVFVGHSISGMIAAPAALERPECVDRLVLLSAAPRYLDVVAYAVDYAVGFGRDDIEAMIQHREQNFLTWCRESARYVMAKPDRPDLADELSTILERQDPQMVRHFFEVAFDSHTRSELPRLTARALILRGADDVTLPAAIADYPHQHLQNSELVQLRATGHLPSMSAPQETVAAIRAFL